MQITDKLNHVKYIAIKHGLLSQPPASIRNYKALGRDLPLNGERTQFYFGDDNETRVNFKFAGVWYHITQSDQPLDNDGNQLNLYPLLDDLSNNFNFVTDGN